MSASRVSLLVAVVLGIAALRFCAPVSAGDEWLPLTPEELKMTSEPKAPGAPAVILYRQVDRDDSDPERPHEYNYVRTKILTEEGRKYADVEIPVLKQQWDVHHINARTIRPDGSIVNFDGKVYEKEIVKVRGVKYLAKTFTLSDVQPGSIIECHYMIDFAEGYVFDSHWVLSDDLFTKSAKFYAETLQSMGFAMELAERSSGERQAPGERALFDSHGSSGHSRIRGGRRHATGKSDEAHCGFHLQRRRI